MSEAARSSAPWALVAAVAASLACGTGERRASAPSAYAEPQWPDVFDRTPELLAVVRPKALERDTIYGPLLRRVLDIVRERSRVVAATRALDAMQDADEVIIGVRLQGPTQAGEVVVVVRGVHADIDPAKLVDADGRALWTSGPYAGARELLRAPDSGTGESIDASLFELPGRTWVIATGEARERARAAFAHPTGRPSPELDPTPLAIVRMDGPSLIARVQAMHAVAAILGLARGLRTVTFALPPGTAANVRATLAYDDDDSAALAEATAREVIEAIARKKPERLAWLGAARVDRSPKDARQVVVSAPLPAELVGALLHAGSAAFEPPTGSP